MAAFQPGPQAMNSIARFCKAAPEVHPVCKKGLYGYQLNHDANRAFAVLFALAAVAYLIVYACKRTGTDFTVLMLLGISLEIVGYGARMQSVRNPFHEDAFFLQICSLAIGPAFLTAAVYLCMRRIVFCFGAGDSRFRPQFYTRMAVGGGLAAVAYKHSGSMKTGNNIMLAGLAFQVFTMILFIVFAGEFAWRICARYRIDGAAVFGRAHSLAKGRDLVLFLLFVAALSIATLCIFVRCCFRLAELSGGWTGELMRNQTLFLVFEGVMVFLATAVLVIMHPVWSFKPMLESGDGMRLKVFEKYREHRGKRNSAIVRSDLED
ncbi:parasitic phase-specific protein PSP-1 [Coniella lustricola]|uniref:Parasitic phase-specific protein PSP-1 n=1 Tax=Coniella lustricola TaxID=2025994 RepID=A0A2T3A6V3_9PEZI|nr:parasitic phase-specific protein PSP-1 [Coniella lustricola]